MKILGFDCSATPASCAVTENSRVLASAFINVKITHSQTLMPLATSLLKAANININDIDALAITNGPGSFTGIRIGISAVKGICVANKKPCIGISTLYAIAKNFEFLNCYVCAVMDARCNQVYNAIFKIENGNITRICDDRAVMMNDVASDLKNLTGSLDIIIAGDGTEIFYPLVKDLKNVTKAAEHLKYQNAVSVCLAAEDEYNTGNTVSPNEILPVYLRLPQAERELKLKNKGN